MTQGRRADALAVGVVVAVHMALLWTLMESSRRAPHRGESAPLRVRWIARPRPAEFPTQPPAPATATLPVPAGPRPPASHVPGPSSSLPVQRDPAAVAPGRPAGRDYLAQGVEWARTNTDGTPRSPDPFADRRADLPGGEGGERIRMRDPVTPARVMGAIATLFGDPGDPCPRMRRNVDDTLVDTSAEGRRRLEWELREYRQRCRP